MSKLDELSGRIRQGSANPFNKEKVKMSNIAHDLEERIMDCWSVTSDIRLAYEEYLDSPKPMDEDELSNILIGIEYIYNRKFQRLWQAFENVCDHGGVFLDDDFKGHKIEFPTKEDKARWDILRKDDDNHISEPPD
jgi:hypothetical protein